MEYRKHYIDLDTLYDTRYAILEKIGIEPEDYLTRTSDQFKYLGASTFNLLYLYRSRDIFLRAKPTIMFNVVRSIILENRDNDLKSGICMSNKLYINHYPYILNDDEKNELIEIYTIGNALLDVELIYKQPNDWVIEKYDHIYMYDGLTLLNNYLVSHDIIDKPIKDTNIYLPSIVDYDRGEKERDDCLLAIMDGTKLFIDIQFLDISNYCNIDLINTFKG